LANEANMIDGCKPPGSTQAQDYRSKAAQPKAALAGIRGVYDNNGGGKRMHPASHQAGLQDRLRHHVDILSELIGERNSVCRSAIEAARAYLRRELGEMGHAVLEQTFATTCRRAVNLEVVLPGSRTSAGTLVVGAHYDSAIGTPGADDNASAVAILLEMVRALSSATPKRTVRFVFYDCEEPPHFNMGEMGSQAHAKALRAGGERLLGMICLESLGYFPENPRADLFVPWYVRLLNRLVGSRNVVIVSDLGSVAFGLRFVWAFLRSGHFPFVPAAAPRRFLPVIELSDHRSYWDQAYPALMVTNTAFLRNPNYHQPTDRLATLDLVRMTALCHTLTRCVARLAT
jgi:hypothetical protein